MFIYVRIVSFLLFSIILNRIGCGHAIFILKKFVNCDPKANYSAKYNLTITTLNGKQYIDGMVILTAPIDNTLRANVSVEMLTGSTYAYLFSITEKKSCTAAHKYLGEFLYDLERQMQLIPGMCPIQMGKHRVHNALLNFEKITVLTTLPFGNLRVIVMVYDRNSNIYTCLLVEVENYI